MKNVIITLMVNFVCLHFSFGQCSNTQMYDIYTPVGSLVNTWLMCEASTATRMANDDYCRNVYPNAQQIIVYDSLSSTSKFNCHGYAWLRVEQGIDRWIGYYYDNIDPDIYMTDGSYTQVPSETFPGKVFWPKADDHSAITTEQQGWFISKWGAYSLCRHRWDDQPYGTTNLKYYVKNCQPVNFFNKVVTTNTTVTSCGDINVQNVRVQNGAKLIFDAAGEVNFISDFEVALGSEFEIR